MTKVVSLFLAIFSALVRLKSSLSRLLQSLFASVSRWRAAVSPSPTHLLIEELMATLAGIQTALANQATQLDLVVAKMAALKAVVPADPTAIDAVASAVAAADAKIAAALA